MGLTIQTAGCDTWLARELFAREVLPLDTLQEALARARAGRAQGATLARVLIDQGHLPRTELEALLQALPSPELPEAWAIGGQVDRFRIDAELGAGGMGIVYRASDIETGAPYAIKTIGRGADPELLLRFQREAEAQARVDAHPNIVKIHSLGTAAGRTYLVQDLATGGDLGRKLAAGALPPQEAATIVRDLARGLASVHAAGVLHRDLKPENVLFDERHTPKLVDFGLAHIAGLDTLTQSGTVMGSPRYMAPEQARGEPADPRTDVYGLGAILYHCLSGRPPFTAAGVMSILYHVLERAPPPLPQAVPTALADICLAALSKAPEQRPPSAAALAEQLQAWLTDPDPQPPSRRRALAIAGVLLVVVAVAVAVAAAAARSDPARVSNPTAKATPRPRPTQPRPPEPSLARRPSERVALAASLAREQRWAEALELVEGPPLPASAKQALRRDVQARVGAILDQAAPTTSWTAAHLRELTALLHLARALDPRAPFDPTLRDRLAETIRNPRVVDADFAHLVNAFAVALRGAGQEAPLTDLVQWVLAVFHDTKDLQIVLTGFHSPPDASSPALLLALGELASRLSSRRYATAREQQTALEYATSAFRRARPGSSGAAKALRLLGSVQVRLGLLHKAATTLGQVLETRAAAPADRQEALGLLAHVCWRLGSRATDEHERARQRRRAVDYAHQFLQPREWPRSIVGDRCMAILYDAAHDPSLERRLSLGELVKLLDAMIARRTRRLAGWAVRLAQLQLSAQLPGQAQRSLQTAAKRFRLEARADSPRARRVDRIRARLERGEPAPDLDALIHDLDRERKQGNGLDP